MTEEARKPSKPRPMKTLPAVETATLAHAHNEVAAVAAWADKLGYREVAPRLFWAAAVIERHRKNNPLPSPPDEAERTA